VFKKKEEKAELKKSLLMPQTQKKLKQKYGVKEIFSAEFF